MSEIVSTDNNFINILLFVEFKCVLDIVCPTKTIWRLNPQYGGVGVVETLRTGAQCEFMVEGTIKAES